MPDQHDSSKPAESSPQEDRPQLETNESSAPMVMGGIFMSKIMGFLREGTVAYFFGAGVFTDVFQYAMKGPNLLQNLLGEGTISASFIPIYSRMIKQGRHKEAGRFAGAIFGLLLVLASVLALLGVILAEPIVTILAPGWTGDAARVAAGELDVNRFELTVQAVRIIFPMAGLLVLSAWCLGVLNSHRKFFLPYFAPVLWNTAIIAGLFGMGIYLLPNVLAIEGPDAITVGPQTRILFAAFFGALAGGALQFLVQVPLVWKEIEGFRFSLSTKVEGVREAISAFGPVVAGRGVYQISAYVDFVLASWLSAGAPAALRFATILYTLPVSLFGMSVAASELPELSRISREQMESFLRRLGSSMRQMMFLTVPTFIGYLALGFLVVGVLFRRGSFVLDDHLLVYFVLCGYSIGLLATTASRLMQNAFYALGDTKTPAKIAVLRVAVSAVVALSLMFYLDQFTVSGLLNFEAEGDVRHLGAIGLAIGASAGAWVELWSLLYALGSDNVDYGLPWERIGIMCGLSLISLIPAFGLWYVISHWHLVFVGLLVLGVYAFTYLGIAYFANFSELRAWTGRLFKRTSTE